jgi:hypothetical protein
VSVISIRLRTAQALAPPLARSMRWTPLVAAVVSLFPVVHWMTGETGYPPANLDERVQAARVTAILLCLGLAFVLDDPATESTAHLPVPPSFRRALRILLAVPVASIPWWAAITFASRAPITGLDFPWGPASLELAALATLALAAAVVGARLASDRLGGVAAGPAFLGFLAAALLLPRRVRLFETPSSGEAWRAAHHRWWIVLAAAAACLVLAGRDPGRWRRRAAKGSQGCGRPAGERTVTGTRR